MGDQPSKRYADQNFKRWFNELSERPAVQRGLAVGKDFGTDAAALSPEEAERRARLLYNQRARPVG